MVAAYGKSGRAGEAAVSACPTRAQLRSQPRAEAASFEVRRSEAKRLRGAFDETQTEDEGLTHRRAARCTRRPPCRSPAPHSGGPRAGVRPPCVCVRLRGRARVAWTWQWQPQPLHAGPYSAVARVARPSSRGCCSPWCPREHRAKKSCGCCCYCCCCRPQLCQHRSAAGPRPSGFRT